MGLLIGLVIGIVVGLLVEADCTAVCIWKRRNSQLLCV